MPGDFESTPHDGHHDALEPGSDWRGGSGILDAAARYVSYGNFAGPGNRVLTENPDYAAAQRAKDPHYDETNDPRFKNDPRYQPIDGIDAAAQRHDGGYERHHIDGQDPFFSWEGLKAVHGDDKALVDGVQNEMDTRGGEYSQTAKNYSEGLRGFFGSRVMGVDAVDWAGQKVDATEHGLSGALDDARSWGSLDDAGRGLAKDAVGAGHFVEESAEEAWSGVAGAGKKIGSLGWPGMLGAVAGFGDVALAGGRNVATSAWDGVKSAGGAVAGGASRLWSFLGGEP